MRWFSTATLCSLAVVLVSGPGWAQVINGCIKGNGTLKVVADPSQCSSRGAFCPRLSQVSSCSREPRLTLGANTASLEG